MSVTGKQASKFKSTSKWTLVYESQFILICQTMNVAFYQSQNGRKYILTRVNVLLKTKMTNNQALNSKTCTIQLIIIIIQTNKPTHRHINQNIKPFVYNNRGKLNHLINWFPSIYRVLVRVFFFFLFFFIGFIYFHEKCLSTKGHTKHPELNTFGIVFIFLFGWTIAMIFDWTAFLTHAKLYRNVMNINIHSMLKCCSSNGLICLRVNCSHNYRKSCRLIKSWSMHFHNWSFKCFIIYFFSLFLMIKYASRSFFFFGCCCCFCCSCLAHITYRHHLFFLSFYSH